MTVSNGPRVASDALFMFLDSNKDGRFTANDAAYSQFAKYFENDPSMTVTELVTYLKKAVSGDPQFAGLLKNLFKTLDRTGNGAVTSWDSDAYRVMRGVFDDNKSCAISYKEFVKNIKEEMAHVAPPQQNAEPSHLTFFNFLDSNMDGTFSNADALYASLSKHFENDPNMTPEELKTYMRLSATANSGYEMMPKSWFDALDTNDDGRINTQDGTYSTSFHQTFDDNRSGWISYDEFLDNVRNG